MTRAALALLICCSAGICSSRLAAGQSEGVRAYSLTVGSASASGPFNEAGASILQRLRFMATPGLGPLSLDVAYEQVLLVTSTAEVGQLTGAFALSPTGGEWLDLQATLIDSESVRLSHRLDRLALTLSADAAELVVGRQAISWASTLLLTPGDPFAPFNPEDPFREYRAGVDAYRGRAFLGPFTDIDLVVRPAKTLVGETVTALGRFHTAFGSWEVSSWAGVLHGEPAVSAGATVTLAGAAFRTEAVVRREDSRDAPSETVLRFAVGADRSFTVGGRDLYLILEYQRDGYGAGSSRELPQVLLSDAFARGEMQVLGRNTAALQGSYQLHPLWTVDALLMSNLNDPSLLVAPGATLSVSDEVVARAGLYFGAGKGLRSILPPAPGSPIELPASEYGIVPTLGYISLSAFF